MRILLAAVLIGIVATQLDANCVPFGLRLAYGEYYTQQGGPNQLYVMFNTYVPIEINAGKLFQQLRRFW
jgi:hypothetical protein